MTVNLYVVIQVSMDPDTGKPFVWSSRGGKFERVPIDLAEYTVDEKYRKYLQLTGEFLCYYIKAHGLSFSRRMTATPEEFLEHYPTWPEVVKDMDDTDGWDCWKETEHNEFKSFLNWALTKNEFRLSWDY